MNEYTVGQLQTDVKRKVHGGSLGSDFYGSMDEGRRNMIGKIKPPEMLRTSYIEQALYPKIDRYAVPTDLKYEDVVNIRKLSSWRNVDRDWRPLAQLYKRQFDQKLRENIFSINWENGVKYMEIYKPTGMHDCTFLDINKCDSLDDNGTWNVGGNVGNLRLDELNHITRKASLQFDINDSSTEGSIENFTMDVVDIKDYLEKGAVFTWLDIQRFQSITSVKLTLGSNVGDLTTDLLHFTVNQPHDNNQFVNGWNLLKFPLRDMTMVGTPNVKEIQYVRIDITTTGETINNMHLDAITVRKGEVYEMDYNSSYCVISPETYVWKKRATSPTDILPFEEDTYQIYMLEVALVVQKEIYSNNGGAREDVTSIEGELLDKYKTYMRKHKDQFIEPEQSSNLYGRMRYGYYGVWGRGYDHGDDLRRHGGE